ncbi:Diacylglycerol O-acyltransferase [Nocardia seriolae]|uniref:diacylglycerol O-acyltransferase n=2 Tax=Nocardia seriolae TaxID=37332 RepID=A0ABC8AX91_9NOCA|nr:wax ester/triacylglycerol synthase domain-containing protein [Nocardia seriolae]APA98722.1 Diacylglycerol O-acyltransferase [Nocardia seriolae]BEK95986.1 wax ester/triacylglycerol synthase family O-acyltransferase [Nocardia seriolae]GEM28372.1 diacylglycerol O-acyltransferase [Nocardia seriolae NBRC 15557]
MSQSDLFTWSMEQDPNLRSTIVSVLLLDSEPDWDRLLGMIDRGTRAVPRFRHRLRPVPLGLAPPRWALDPDFDLSWHVRHFEPAAPADLSSVLEFARTEAMAAFDPARPLWRFTVLSGLEGGKSALVLKVHHSLTDGIGGMQIAGEILDFERAGTDRAHVPDAAHPDVRGMLGDIVAWNWSVGAGLVRGGMAAVLPAVRRTVTDPVGAIKDGAALAGSLLRLAHPITSTLSPLMTDRSLGRRLTVLEVPLDALRRSAHLVGCTVNDAFLAAVLIGLRAYHDRHDTAVEQLRVAMPISLRRAVDPIGGNRITLARFEVPVDVAAAVDLMRALDATVEGWKREPAIPFSNAVAATFNRLPVGLLTDMFKHVDFVASDVPGSPVDLYLAGAKVERIYPFGPTTGTAFNITLISHVDTCCVGINTDTGAVPDPALLTECIAAGFRVVTGLGEDQSPKIIRLSPGDRRGPSEQDRRPSTL